MVLHPCPNVQSDSSMIQSNQGDKLTSEGVKMREFGILLFRSRL